MPGSTQSKTRLSRRQQQILEYIRESVISRGFPPSIREIGEAVGLSSSSTVHSHLKSLETKGFLRRNPSKPRSIELLDGPRVGGVRMVEIPVSDPQHADGPKKTISLPLELVGDQESFLYQINEPYRNENIVPGDLVIVNRNNGAVNGELVLERQGQELRLTRWSEQPARASEPVHDSVVGRVVGVIRRFNNG
ncbi:MAG: repressor LexA [Candidatus Eremiobacteraeota bacterium]|nr:repressor LexA [Candidatus Eremiobacteraeota bacterium]MCW5872548.1 repressor LexA [Candidatus Eremiobacteraeota bacterium]